MHDHSTEEIRRLQRCISDLVGVLALPAICSGGDPAQIVRTLLDVLLSMLRLDLVYVRLRDPLEAPIEMFRVAQPQRLTARPQEIGEALDYSLGPNPETWKWAPLLRNPIGGGDMTIVPLRLGLQGEIGLIVAGSHRADFPGQTEMLVLSVAANQAVIGLQEARVLSEQRRVANELDQRVAERTRELAAANEALKREIAERKMAEKMLRQEERELKRSEARKAAILDSALDCVITIDHEGCITEFNPAAERTFGYRRNDVMGSLADVMIPPSLREGHRRGLVRYLATGAGSMIGKRIETTAVRADGSEFPVELTITRISWDGPPSFTGYLRDITERKRSELELRRSEAFLAEGQRLSSTGSFSWRVDTHVVTWSEELYRIYAIEQGTPVTLALIATRHHPDDIPMLNEKVDRARSAGSDFEHDHRLQMPDHSVKYLHMVAHATRDRDGRLEYIGAVQDVTQRRLSEEAAANARSELAHAARVASLGALTASITHEVSQPLAGIINNANTGLRMLAALPPDVDGARETVRRTIRDGNRASDVITRLRALFAKKDPNAEIVDLNEATREVISLSLSDLQRKRVILRTELAEGLPPVIGDRVQLQQVILNLFLNAADAMSSVDDRPRQLLIRTEQEEENRVRLSVQDTGVGFDLHGVDRLFEAFYTTKSSGMGIGLSISRSIIESHRGRLWAAPNDGPGATFSFSVPSRSQCEMGRRAAPAQATHGTA